MYLARFTLLVLALAGLLALPTAAGAAQRTETFQPVSAAAAVAAGFWGAVPCNGQITYRTRARPVGSAHSDGWVTFNSPLGANNLAADASSYTDCTVSFGRSRWPTTASMRQDWDIFCMTMIHELGHLLGHSHDVTRGSIMVAVFSDYSSEPAACRAARPATR